MWVPYRNLFFLGLLQTRQHFRVASEDQVIQAARHRAENMVRAGYPVLDVYDKDSAYGDVWPSPEVDLHLFQRAKFSPELEAFVLRGRRGSREALDRLLLSYAAQGLSPEDVYRESYEDYLSIRGVTALTQEDVANYGIFFWDFATLLNVRDGTDWLNRHGLYTEAAILSGEVMLDDVRATLGAERGLDFERRLKTLTYKNSRVMERILDQMLEMQDSELLAGGRNGTEYIKNSAAFVASAIAMMKLYKDTAQGTGSEQTLADILRIRMNNAKAEGDKARKVPDWAALQRDDLTPEDLLAANQARRANEST